MRSAQTPPRAALRSTASPLAALLLIPVVLISGCARGASTIPVIPSPAAAATPGHAPEIRIGLVGDLAHQNVWALFAGESYSYNDYAVRARYWPRLYDLPIGAQDLEPRLAADMPAALHPEGVFQTASITVRTDLHWSDGAAFTAQDVAFTVNAALQFELGFDWVAFYDLSLLDHAEAISTDSVKYFFKTQPGVQAWQLGALQGPVVQAAYWAPKVADAAALLPQAETRAHIQVLEQKVAQLQNDVNALYAQAPFVQGEQARELQANLRRQQGNLDQAMNDLTKEKTGLDEALQAARRALFQLDASAEPLLGPWLPAATSTAGTETNLVDATYPGLEAHFDQATYFIYPSADAAAQALAAGDVNLVLDPAAPAPAAPGSGMVSPSRSLRFLLFNQTAPGLGDPALRLALACMLDQAEIARRIGNAMPLESAVPAQESLWHDPEARLPCAGMNASQRLAQAVETLKSRGYSWDREPADGQAGLGMKSPDGSAVPAVRLMAPSSDEQRSGAATYILEAAAPLGIQFTFQLVPMDALDYAVLSSGDFDLAIVGWRVGTYPGYLCGWFNTGGNFSYSPSALPSLCDQLQAAADMQDARLDVSAIQRALVQELPLVPLYSVAVTDTTRGIAYPFESVLDGLAGAYGALEMAYPATP